MLEKLGRPPQVGRVIPPKRKGRCADPFGEIFRPHRQVGRGCFGGRGLAVGQGQPRRSMACQPRRRPLTPATIKLSNFRRTHGHHPEAPRTAFSLTRTRLLPVRPIAATRSEMLSFGPICRKARRPPSPFTVLSSTGVYQLGGRLALPEALDELCCARLAATPHATAEASLRRPETPTAPLHREWSTTALNPSQLTARTGFRSRPCS